jgi:hypothetical protein
VNEIEEEFDDVSSVESNQSLPLPIVLTQNEIDALELNPLCMTNTTMNYQPDIASILDINSIDILVKVDFLTVLGPFMSLSSQTWHYSKTKNEKIPWIITQ